MIEEPDRKKPVVTAQELQSRPRGHRPEEQLSSTRVHAGRIVTLDTDRVRLPDGNEKDMDVVRHSGASGILPFLTDPTGETPQVLLMRQYRYAAGGYLYEIPAGRLDDGERPEACAARELKEETGCSAGQLTPLTSILTTPGFSDEIIHLFMATDITMGEPDREADEFVELVVMRLSEALERISTGEIVDVKTVIALLFAAGFRTGE